MAFDVYDVSDFGCILQVGLRVGASYAKAGKGGPPSSWTALIDTGAMVTAISPSIVKNLSPRPGNSVAIRRPTSGVTRSLIYEVELKLNGYLSKGRWFDLQVVEARPALPGVDVLIGMDLLIQLHVYLSGPNRKMILSDGIGF